MDNLVISQIASSGVMDLLSSTENCLIICFCDGINSPGLDVQVDVSSDEDCRIELNELALELGFLRRWRT